MTATGISARDLDLEPSETPSFTARVGSVFLLVDDAAEPATVRDQIARALADDPRVSALNPLDPLDDDFNNEQLVFPALTDPSDEAATAALIGSDGRRSLRWSREITFTVHVPLKNQPTYFSGDQPPSEDYYAYWDGFTLMVGWEMAADSRLSAAGGQVVMTILDEIAQACGYETYVQACMPSCHHLFAHTNLRITPTSSSFDTSFSPGAGSDVIVETPDLRSPLDTLGFVFGNLRGAFEEFAFTKNRARRVLDLEQLARGTLLHLTRLDFQRAHVLEHRLRERPRLRWETRGLRPQERLDLARLWVLLASMEEVRRDWSDWRSRFRGIASESGLDPVFALDRRDDDIAVESLNTALMQQGVRDAGYRLASRALVAATATAGVAGVIGVLVGHFL